TMVVVIRTLIRRHRSEAIIAYSRRRNQASTNVVFIACKSDTMRRAHPAAPTWIPVAVGIFNYTVLAFWIFITSILQFRQISIFIQFFQTIFAPTHVDTSIEIVCGVYSVTDAWLTA